MSNKQVRERFRDESLSWQRYSIDCKSRLFFGLYIIQWSEKVFIGSLYRWISHGSWTCIKRKKLSMVIFFIFLHKNVCRSRFEEIKIRSWEGFEKIEFFSLFFRRKRLSSGQKSFLRPYIPLIRGMFVFRSGLRFSFRTESEEKV